MLFLTNLQLHKKDDDPSRTETISDSKELQQSIQERDRRIATRESQLRMKEAQLIVAMTPKKEKRDDDAVQANYLTEAKCKKPLVLLASCCDI